MVMDVSAEWRQRLFQGSTGRTDRRCFPTLLPGTILDCHWSVSSDTMTRWSRQMAWSTWAMAVWRRPASGWLGSTTTWCCCCCSNAMSSSSFAFGEEEVVDMLWVKEEEGSIV